MQFYFLLNIDPVILPIWGPIAIRWYGLAYLIGIISSFYYSVGIIKKTSAYDLLNKTKIETLFSHGLLAAIIGGRVGYFLFYAPLNSFFNDPLAIFRIWEGGMSFHGGLIAAVLYVVSWSKRNHIPPLRMLDYIAISAPIGLGFGRLANFINQEMCGTITAMPWGVIFLTVDHFPRHPTQLYEAFSEGALLFLILWYWGYKQRWLARRGTISGLFLVGYSVCRILIEYFKEPEVYIPGPFSWGQILTFPFLILGLFLLVRSIKK